MSNRLQNKVSIITGAGSGIGRGIALLFAKEGSKVVVVDINPDAGKETVEMIKGFGGNSVFIQADVSKSPDVENMVSQCMSNYGQLNILCNNAGIMEAEPPLVSDLPEPLWDFVINNNLKSVYLCCKYSIPQMIKAGGGSIVSIASVAGLVKSPNLAYSASKGGIISLTRSLAMQCAKYNIRVNSICPDAIDTPGSRAAVLRAAGNSPVKQQTTPVTRLASRKGTPEDIAYAALYLASDEASYSTGSTMVVDGGSLRG